MKSMFVAAFAAGFSSLFATAALAGCPAAGCAYVPASPHYTFAPLPAHAAAPAYAPQAYGPRPPYAAPQYAPGGYGPPPYGEPPPYASEGYGPPNGAPQGYGPPAYASPQLPPPPYLNGGAGRQGYGQPGYGPQPYGPPRYDRGEYDALGDNAPVFDEPAFPPGYGQQDYRAVERQAYGRTFQQQPGYPPGYPCVSCAPPPAAYVPRPCPRPAYVCVAPQPETVSLQGDFFTGGVGDTDGGGYGGGGYGGGDNFAYSGGFASLNAAARASVSVHASAHARVSLRGGGHGGGWGHGRGGGCNCGGGKKGHGGRR